MPVLDASGPGPSFDRAVDAAAAVLAAGGVVGIPTDTVYGLATDPVAPGSSEAVFALKGRPADTPLPVLVAGVDQAARVGRLGTVGLLLAETLWPGGLTLVVERQAGVEWDLGGSPATVGLRCPDHPVALALCLRGPITATSANRHGEPALAGAAEVAEAFPGLLVLDGGECRGVPSTVVDLTGAVPVLRRAGAVDWEQVEALLGQGPP